MKSKVLKSEIRSYLEAPDLATYSDTIILQCCLTHIEKLEEALRYIREITPVTSVGGSLVHRKIQEMFSS
jgi:hypothetical protein